MSITLRDAIADHFKANPGRYVGRVRCAIDGRRSRVDLFWAKVEKTDTCWNWTANKTASGYGMFKIGGVSFRAHRFAWVLAGNDIPDDLVIDHLCRNRACVNPAHLRVCTQVENMRSSAEATKTHCKRGHEFTPENTASYNGHDRVCRACDNERSKAKRLAARRSHVSHAS